MLTTVTFLAWKCSIEALFDTISQENILFVYYLIRMIRNFSVLTEKTIPYHEAASHMMNKVCICWFYGLMAIGLFWFLIYIV